MPAVDAKLGPKLLQIGDQVLRGIVPDLSQRRRAAGARLIDDDDPVMGRIEEPAVGGRRSRPRPAMQEHHRDSARIAGLFPVKGMYRIDLEQTGLIGVDRREQLGAWHRGGPYGVVSLRVYGTANAVA